MGIDAEMFVRVSRIVDADEVQKTAVAMQVAFGPNSVLDVIRPNKWKWAQAGRHSLEIVERWEQDGPDIDPEPGETFIRVNLGTRFYGPGYERGNIVGILAVADYLKARFSPCSIWYGGDSSGVCARNLDDGFRDELWRHFCSESSRNYFDHGRCFVGERDESVRCDFCHIKANANMWSGATSGHSCPSCGQRWLRYGDGRIVEADEKYNPVGVAS